jgi:hypothetical protein
MDTLKFQKLGQLNKIISYVEQRAFQENPSAAISLSIGKIAHGEISAKNVIKIGVAQSYNQTPLQKDVLSSNIDLLGKTLSSSLKQSNLKDCVSNPGDCRKPFFNIQLTPSKEILDILKADLESSIQNLDDLLQVSNGARNVLLDICNLLSYLNFHCLEDILRMKLALLSLQRRYLNFPDLGKVGFMDLVKVLMAPFAATMNLQIDKLVQLLLNPMNCIRAHLQYSIQSIGITKEITGDEQKLEHLQSSLVKLDRHLGDYYSWARANEIRARKILNEWCSFHRATSAEYTKALQALAEIRALIGVLETFEKFATDPKFASLCESRTASPEDLTRTFLSDKINDLQKIISSHDLVKEDGEFYLTPKDRTAGIVTVTQRKSVSDNGSTKIRLSCMERLQSSPSEDIKRWLSRIGE